MLVVIFVKAVSAQKTFCNDLCSFENYMKQSPPRQELVCRELTTSSNVIQDFNSHLLARHKKTCIYA